MATSAGSPASTYHPMERAALVLGGDEDTFWRPFSDAIESGEMEALDQILRESERSGRKGELLGRYREVLLYYTPPETRRLEDDELIRFARLEAEFFLLAREGDSEGLGVVLAESEQCPGWLKVYFLASYMNSFQKLPEKHEAVSGRVLEEIQRCIQTHPSAFDFADFIHEEENSELWLRASQLAIRYTTLPTGFYLPCDRWQIAIDSCRCIPRQLDDAQAQLLKRAFLERDQAEIERFRCIFNRVDFVLAWKEKRDPLSGVGLLPPEIARKIVKFITWPSVHCWSLSEAEKAHDELENPIYRQALLARTAANETATRQAARP